ncbi:FAD dependent oxidoreductase [Zopfochytrium polystomum]|nr:FAD dependent oxidoreductase [Zopfochytrium polystomum]
MKDVEDLGPAPATTNRGRANAAALNSGPCSTCSSCPSPSANCTSSPSMSAQQLGTATNPDRSGAAAGRPNPSSSSNLYDPMGLLPLYDVVIVGAGVIGCSIARELSRYRLKVIVIEKGEDVASGASKANSGIVHGGYDELHGTLKSKVAHKGNQMFHRLNEELNFGFRVTGSLVLAFEPSEVPELERLLENGRKKRFTSGVKDLRIIGRDEILAKEPHINPEVFAALFCPHTGITSPYEYTIALAENAILNGVEFRLQHEVTDIQRIGNRGGHLGYLVSAGSDEKIMTRYVVNAAGLFADKVASMVGAANFYIAPRKGEYIILDKSQGLMASHVLFPVPSPTRGKGILVSQTFHGNLLLGPTSREMSEAHRTNIEVLEEIVAVARHSVPDFDVKKAITSYAGLRAKSDRKDFIIEESEKAPGFVNVAGIDSPGLTSSPAVAQMTVDVLRKAGLKTEGKSWFSPYRRPIIIKKTEGYKGVIDHPTDASLNIICRCERVSEAEIVDAIHRPLGAHSIDAVKKRTRAGMGWCQGGFCEPRVVALISRETKIPIDQVPRRGVGSSLLPHKRITEEDRQLLEELSWHRRGDGAKKAASKL